MAIDLPLAPKTKRPPGEPCCEPVVYPDVEREQAVRMAAVAKALDEHQELFRMYGDPWYYDTRLVASSKVIPMAPGAMR